MVILDGISTIIKKLYVVVVPGIVLNSVSKRSTRAQPASRHSVFWFFEKEKEETTAFSVKHPEAKVRSNCFVCIT